MLRQLPGLFFILTSAFQTHSTSFVPTPLQKHSGVCHDSDSGCCLWYAVTVVQAVICGVTATMIQAVICGVTVTEIQAVICGVTATVIRAVICGVTTTVIQAVTCAYQALQER